MTSLALWQQGAAQDPPYGLAALCPSLLCLRLVGILKTHVCPPTQDPFYRGPAQWKNIASPELIRLQRLLSRRWPHSWSEGPALSLAS